MRAGNYWHSSAFILLIFALVLSLALIATPVLAPAVVSEPGGTITDVASGDNFVLRFRLRWDRPGMENLGYFSLGVTWDSPGENGAPSENFTFMSAEAYFDNGDPITVGTIREDRVVAGNRRYTIVVDHSEGNPRDGEFNVNLRFRAAGAGGVLHAAMENHPIEIVGTIDVPEGDAIYSYTPPNRFITVKVLTRGVAATISPSYQSAPPGSTLDYIVTVSNTGDVEDNFTLTANDNLGWGLSLSPTKLAVPAGENRTATLSVTIYKNTVPCTEDNVTVIVTGTWVENSATCVAHAAIVRSMSVEVSPGYLSGLPGQTLSYNVVVKNTGNVSDNYALSASDNLNWTLAISPVAMTLAPGQSENATLSVGIPIGAKGSTEDNAIVTATSQTDNAVSASDSCIAHVTIVRRVEVSISPNYQSAPPRTFLEYIVVVKNTGNVDDSYGLTASDNLGWGPNISPTPLTVLAGENRTATLGVIIPENAYGCTEDNIIAAATSTSDPTVSGSAACVAHAAIVRGVDVSISPSYQGGLPGATLTYIVAVQNTGNVSDNYVLTVGDNMGWGLTISPTSLTLAPRALENATLSVAVPENALPCTADNIIVLATSRENAEVTASGTCVAHVVGFRTEITTLIYPTADVYAYGEYGKGYSRTQLKFNISSIPAGSNILSARLWLFKWSASGWDGNITLYRVDNQIWGEAITAGEFDAQVLTDRADFENKFMLGGWDSLNVLNQLRVDHNAGYSSASFRLRWASDNGGEPSVGVDDGRFLVINSELTGMNVIFCSSEYDGSDPYLEVTYVPPYALSISISPDQKSGLPSTPISYTISIANTGNLGDTYDLTAIDNMGWGLTITPASITLAPGTLGEAVLSIAVPENTLPCTKDNVIAIATSRGDPTVSASASCMAHRLKGEFDLVTLYKVSLDADIYLAEGSRLVIKFYTWAGTFEGERVVWTGMTPTHVIFVENVPHPENKVVENATLVLTDDAGNVISTFTRFVLTRSHMMRRRSAIKLRWPYALTEEKINLMFELSAMKSRWPYAPA